ncbi:post-GPI attachment to proteins factor 3 [Fopius arisanus]|uniref:Post-GPI attachment to proteins factor 3 n=1 Tax=Fopius arisanus TaxID=64838 RepID=A0A9R1TV55_9HYME|nr:PREDICTED: post-GPI attachment to proteins factor 3 [Fopius arisanus]
MLGFAIFLATIFGGFRGAQGSPGDNSQFYRQCLFRCYSESCRHNVQFEISEFSLFSWTCEENCKYDCMWETVGQFLEHGLQIPQFHGKWPFVRIIGLQEPASVIFSVLNLYGHFTMYRRFRREIRSSYPMSLMWTYLAVVCMNGWFWSAVFHSRDRPFTEVMDYSCAFTIVVTLLFCILVRIFHRRKKAFVVITCAYLSILFTHLSHLWSGRINYGYNMKLNIFCGFLTFVISMIWWYRNSRKLKHIYLLGWFNIISVAVTLLEVADFPPILWVFDAHSLWHAATAPLVYFLYRFMILDCQYLRKQDSLLIIDETHIE